MVQLSEEAYRRLAREKLPGESFSDVILRRFPGGAIQNLRGILTADQAQRAQQTIDEIDAYSLAKQDRQMRERGLL